MELFYDKFKNNTLVQNRNTCSAFLDKFGNIKDKEAYDSTLAEYNSQKEDIKQNFDNFNKFYDNSVIEYWNDNAELLFSFIGEIVIDKGISSIMQVSINVAESLLNNCEVYKDDIRLKKINELLKKIMIQIQLGGEKEEE